MAGDQWTAAAQICLSVATLAVAFAVYRIQADKLFLEMRDKRNEALDAFRDALRARLDEVATLSVNYIDADVERVASSGKTIEFWQAEMTLRRWFGRDVAIAAEDARVALNRAQSDRIVWCMSERRSAGSFTPVAETQMASYGAMDAVSVAAAPYVDAGTRGLRVTHRISAWRFQWRAVRKNKRAIP